MHTLGKHFLLDLRDCRGEILNDLELLKEVLLSVAQQVGSEVASESFHRFSPQGISGMVLAAGAHFCIHTWPEHGYAAIDIFTYGDSLQPELVTKLLTEKLESKDPSMTELKRGF